MEAEKRYFDGVEVTTVKQDGTLIKFTKFETDEARIAIAANQAIGKMLAIDEPVTTKSEVVTLTAEEKAIKDEMDKMRASGELPTKPKFD